MNLLEKKEKKKVYVDPAIILEFFLGEARYRRLFSDSMMKKYEFLITVKDYQKLLLGYHAQDLNNKIKFTSIEGLLSLYPYQDSPQAEKYFKHKALKKLKKKKKHESFIHALECAAGYIELYITEDEELIEIGKIESVQITGFDDL